MANVGKAQLKVIRAAKKWAEARYQYLMSGGEKRRIVMSNTEVSLSQAVRELHEEERKDRQ